MKIYVDLDVCDQHGQCVLAAPDVFELPDRGDLQYQDRVGEGMADAVEEAAMLCPVQAITVESEEA
jgi:ferredoxin